MSHNHNNNPESNIVTAFVLNLLFALLELVGGIITNSVAILSDAIHDFGDALSLGVAYYLQKKSRKRGDDKYTYGYRRFSLLGSIFISVVLLFGSLVMIKESIERLINPQEASATGMMILALIGIIVNGAAVLKLKRGSTHNEKAVTLHMMEDVLGWLAVLVGSIIMYFTGISHIDPILSILIAFWVLYNVYRNLRETLTIMLQHSPLNLDVSELEKKINNIPGICSVNDLHVWSIDGIKNIATIDIICKDNIETVTIKNEVRRIFETHGIEHSTIEMDRIEDIDENKKSDACR